MNTIRTTLRRLCGCLCVLALAAAIFPFSAFALKVPARLRPDHYIVDENGSFTSESFSVSEAGLKSDTHNWNLSWKIQNNKIDLWVYSEDMSVTDGSVVPYFVGEDGLTYELYAVKIANEKNVTSTSAQTLLTHEQIESFTQVSDYLINTSEINLSPDNNGRYYVQFGWKLRDGEEEVASCGVNYNLNLPEDSEAVFASKNGGRLDVAESDGILGTIKTNITEFNKTTIYENQKYTIPAFQSNDKTVTYTNLLALNHFGERRFYEFKGWKVGDSETLYPAGRTFEGDELKTLMDTAADGAVTFTAQWEEIEQLDDAALAAAAEKLPLNALAPSGQQVLITQTTNGMENTGEQLTLAAGDVLSYRVSAKMDGGMAVASDPNVGFTDDFATFTYTVTVDPDLVFANAQDGNVTLTYTGKTFQPKEIKINGTEGTIAPTEAAADGVYMLTCPAPTDTPIKIELTVAWFEAAKRSDPYTMELTGLDFKLKDGVAVQDGLTVETTANATGTIDLSKKGLWSIRFYYQTAQNLLNTPEWEEYFGGTDANLTAYVHALQYMDSRLVGFNLSQDPNAALEANTVKAVCVCGEAGVQPADLTIYMGGTKGYEGVLDDDASITASNSLPEPGFYITLPDEVNQALQAAGVAPVGEMANLSQYMRVYTQDGSREWKMEAYGATHSGAYEKHIYRIVPAEDQDPVRLQFTDETGKTYVSDTFDPMAEGNLSNEYTMSIYPGEVDLGNVLLDVKVNNTTYTCKVNVQSGNLYVRYVTGEQTEVVTPVAADIAATTDRSKAYAVAQEGTKFTINESQVDVTNTAAPSLLFDEVVSSDNTTGAGDYRTQLAQKAAQAAGQDFANVQYQAKYLDLVDANNGNVWLKASQPVTVYWPFPEGTDANTKFYLVHFKGLDREMATGDVTWKIEDAAANGVPVTTSEYGVSFMATDGFSPFVLMWETPAEDEPEKPTTGGGDNGGSTPAPTPQRTPAPTAEPAPTATPAPAAVIPQTGDDMPVGLLAGLAIVAAGGLAALLVLRKRRSDR